MTRDKDRKRLVRSRMKKTGEAYTAARAHVISETAITPPPPAVDYAVLAGTRDALVAAKTGRTWHDWVRVLDARQAAAMPHGEIARLLREEHAVDAWWAQAVTVGYERIKGLRERGQRRDGAFEAGKSKTFDVPVKALFDAWAHDGARRRWLQGLDTSVRTATAPKTIRLQWPDGTIVVAGFTAKGPRKSAVALVHTKLKDRAAVARAKADWSERLDALGGWLAGGG